MNILTAKRLTKVYGSRHAGAVTKALNGIDLEVNRGEFVSIMGPSGSGKTTLLNILAGIDRPTSGELRIHGQELAKMRASELALFRRRQLGFVFQDYNLLDSLTAAENVALPLALDGKPGTAVRKKVLEVLEYLGMGEQADRYPYELSGGQQQRIAVARAVVHHPALILADEPTGNLDSASAKALLEVFAKLHREQESTILMVTHDPFAASYSKRVVFIKDGQVFSHLDAPSSRSQFFQEILQALAVLEGTNYDMAPTRM
ncbi:MAG: ABC transporter ATP-binding protein [Alicyclobacillus macrosporangiidus]|uniref:ABC transporter ATP-binding protein n=1 Tax=Alicyclobacillus macrosporangiidus TaxID=392015 RepID=UPI0026ED9D2B|nr:ABC transporter ATP-binding protein [Alicyclobacillus macrosporangiidus]MCL6597694.1 ABC transporter ATP-binding protein [Alicyclobacillus macrosporangiidus]